MSLLTSRDVAGHTALHYCTGNRRPTVINTLLNFILERPDATGNTSSAGDVISSLLESRDSVGLTALAHAVVAGNSMIVDQLLRWGADIGCLDNEGHSVIHLATGMRDIKSNLSASVDA